jgi:ATP-dependent DNA helicase
MGTLSMSDASPIPAKNWDASPVKLEAQGGDAILGMKEEERLLELVKDEQADGILDSLPIDLEAKNGDASLITEAMKKEEEQLEDTRIKVQEEEEARKREEAARLAFDPETQYNKLDELLTKTQLFSEFLLENMDRIADV